VCVCLCVCMRVCVFVCVYVRARTQYVNVFAMCPLERVLGVKYGENQTGRMNIRHDNNIIIPTHV
jgi:hypothetical protein